MILATAFTSGYKWADAYVESLHRHWRCRLTIMAVGHERQDCLTVPCSPLPKAMMQNGLFLDYLPPGDPVIFTDADMVLRRELTEAEYDWMEGVKEGQVISAPNRDARQTISEEALNLFPKPGYEDVLDVYRHDRVFNTGWLLMRRPTWEAVRREFDHLWPAVNQHFDHYARVQLCICLACARLGIRWVPVAPEICSHGHLGLAEGVELTDPPTVHGKVIAFDHRIGC